MLTLFMKIKSVNLITALSFCGADKIRTNIQPKFDQSPRRLSKWTNQNEEKTFNIIPKQYGGYVLRFIYCEF